MTALPHLESSLDQTTLIRFGDRSADPSMQASTSHSVSDRDNTTKPNPRLEQQVSREEPSDSSRSETNLPRRYRMRATACEGRNLSYNTQMDQCKRKYQIQYLTMKQQESPHPAGHSMNTNHAHTYPPIEYPSDCSVGTAHSVNSSVYSRSRRSYRSHSRNQKNRGNVRGTSRKNHRMTTLILSTSLKRFLRNRGWSLPEEAQQICDRQSHDLVLARNPNAVSSNTKSIADPREGELVRRRALNLLESIMCQWASPMESSTASWQRTRVTLVSFGSYRLGAYQQDSDVDLLALCPPTVTREDFFNGLVERMEKEPAIDDVHPIASAYTPVLKFTIYNIHFDMLFGKASGGTNIEKLIRYQQFSGSQCDSLDGSLVPDKKGDVCGDAMREFFIEDSFLLGAEDDSEVRSANGVRVTQFLMEYVPNPDNFRMVLCAVKEWAMLHGIYSNAQGFLGGVNWAIMVAYVCKRFPKLNAMGLLTNFFRIFATWNWPKPVMLEDLTNTNGQEGTPEEIKKMEAATGMKPWDPATNSRDARAVMPVITPVFPRMNSTYNIGIPQQRRIHEELIRAAALTYDQTGWRALYERSDFFERHVNFLQISIRAGNNGDLTRWLRFCESRLRLLVCALECPDMTVWPFAQVMKREFTPESAVAATTNPSNNNGSNSLPEALFFIGLRFAPQVETINLKQQISDFLMNQINNWEDRKPGMDLLIRHITRKDLPLSLIGQHTVPVPSPYEVPDCIPVHGKKNKRAAIPGDILPGCKNFEGSSDFDANSARSTTYSSTASTMNSSMPSDDGTETESSISACEVEIVPHSPLGNLITVEGRPALRGKRNTGDTNGRRNVALSTDKYKEYPKHARHQKAGHSCSQSLSSSKSPIKKRAKGNQQRRKSNASKAPN